MQMWPREAAACAGGAACSAAERVLAADFYALSPAKRQGSARV